MRVPKVLTLSAIAITGIAFAISSTAVLATDNTSSLSLNTNSITQKVNEITQEIASKAATLKSQVTQSIQNKLAVGKITSLNNQQLTLQTDTGIITVAVNTYTIYQTDPASGKQAISLNNLAIGDTVATLGDLDETGVLSAKRVVTLSDQSNQSQKPHYIWGTIQATSEASLKLNDKDNKSIELNIDKNTTFQTGNTQIALPDLKVGFTILALKPKESSAAATFIYLTTPLAKLTQ